jgi:hypothetical protein
MRGIGATPSGACSPPASVCVIADRDRQEAVLTLTP